jgi:hypothetical protein
MKRTVLVFFLMLSLCIGAKATTCFLDPKTAFENAEYVVAGYLDTIVARVDDGLDIGVFVVENSLKGFEETVNLPNVIYLVILKWACMGPGKRLLFLDNYYDDYIFVMVGCTPEMSWHSYKALLENKEYDFPPHKMVVHQGYLSNEYKLSNQRRSNWFGEGRAIISDLKETHERYEESNTRKNIYLIFLSLCTLTLALYNFKPSLFVPTKRPD